MNVGKIILAKQLSRHFHKGQKYGEHDYFDYHIMGVFNTLLKVSKKFLTEEMVIVTALHDILEDTHCTWGTLENIFGYGVANYVDILTYLKGDDRDQYLKDINVYPVTRMVKYADSLFNYNECIKEGNIKRAEKYKYNLDFLYTEKLFKSKYDQKGEVNG